MKTKGIFLFLLASLCTGGQLMAQAAVDMYTIDATTTGQTINYDVNGNATGFMDNGGAGRYSSGDHYVIINSNCPETHRFSLEISELDIDKFDTLIIYDGFGTTGAVRAKINNNTGHRIGDKVFVSRTNTSGTLTVRFKVDPDSSRHGSGFILTAGCNSPCENIYSVIDSMFFRTRNGVVYDTGYQREVPVYDTTFNITAAGDTVGIHHIDTSYFTGVHLCVGDGVIFRGHGVYTQRHGYYTPSDANTYFIWDMANGGDTIQGTNITEISYDQYQRTGCFDLTLTIIDTFGCTSNILTSVRVRTSQNPLKTIFTIGDICNNTERAVTMGYDGDNATLTLRTIENVQLVSKTNEVRTFIPDGPGCPDQCYSAPVLFSEFPNSRTVQSGEDICSICVNMEHTFMGDISVYIVCPNGNRAPLFYGNFDPARPNDDRGEDGAAEYGGGTDMGLPLRNYDGSTCDSLQCPFGGGLDYCFSRNKDYTLVTGVLANSIVGRPYGHHYITCTHQAYQISASDNLVIPAHFTNGGGSTVSYSGNTKRPSDHANRTDYYTPYTDFSPLIGCPLNGTWSIQVCDYWPADNGWVFNWSMDLCGISEQDCRYEVGIDSLVWRPAPGHDDYDLGRFRGLKVRRETPTLSFLSSPDTAGFFPIDVSIYDEFGCVWDTVTSITTYWSPEPNLGPDTTLCGVATMELDARDRHSELPTENYTYLWNPYGQETPSIITEPEQGDVTYIVQVKNTRRNTVCSTRDTILIRQRKQPLPSFEPSPFTYEGCAPLTLTFNNTSVDADHHRWDFGDGITSEFESPTHTFAEGVYTLKYYASSDEGCIDSVIAIDGITVYPTPQAGFIWEPVYPSVLNPVVQFTNTTEPHTGNSHYRWELQYDRDNNLSVHTLTDRNPTFNYATYAGEGLSGSYAVRLIAYTENITPRGKVLQCRDTAENMILIVNDFLQFPNVVTPNGDGINDRFVIVNLLDGIGYPINQLDIYNRWGTRVYHKENISTDEDFWDPADLPAGTYFYRFSAKGYSGNIEHNGAIEVIK